jgi:hypothetical protein
MEQEPQHPGSHLFTVRLWQEELGGGQAEWRGRAHDIETGEAAYFRDWTGLIAVLSRLLEATHTSMHDPSRQPTGGPAPRTRSQDGDCR